VEGFVDGRLNLMGIDVALIDEFGCKIDGFGDPSSLLFPLFPPRDGPGFPFLTSIDPYEDTLFNGSQMERFLAEWAYVVAQAQSEAEKQIVEAVRQMASRCEREVHTYLKFIGD